LLLQYRWAWKQIEKDDNDLVKLGAKQQVLDVLSVFNDHAKGCNIISLIKECRRTNTGFLEDGDMQTLLMVKLLSPRMQTGLCADSPPRPDSELWGTR
jgi:hypothetical protein